MAPRARAGPGRLGGAVTPVAVIAADNLGSLLRPAYLLEARRRGVAGEELRAIEDRAIVEAIALQEEVGLPIVTDGEFRRRLFFSTVEGLFDGLDPEGYVRTHRDEAGNVEEVRTPTPVARLARRGYLADAELDFLLAHTDRPVKITMPSPSLLDVYWTEERSGRAYPTREAYLEHLVELMHEDAVELAARGVAHIQLDAPHYAYIQSVLPDIADRDATLRRLVERDNEVLRGIDGVTRCLHICRGNYKSRFTGTEPYDGFAASILPYAEFDRLLLEYDDERSGGFAPLRHARDDATIVLGLVTTKRSDLESADELRARLEEASRYVPLERLALSTQCGFGSTAEGNLITHEAQRAKLELVVAVARDVWGDAP
jgi:5-methyltetrahydropteroyltriglutamate--homocysteine methyltransferase